MYDSSLPPQLANDSHFNNKREAVCPDCGGLKDKYVLSACCDAIIYDYPDNDFCSDCKEHAEPQVCETCDGSGTISKTTI